MLGDSKFDHSCADHKILNVVETLSNFMHSNIDGKESRLENVCDLCLNLL